MNKYFLLTLLFTQPLLASNWIKLGELNTVNGDAKVVIDKDSIKKTSDKSIITYTAKVIFKNPQSVGNNQIFYQEAKAWKANCSNQQIAILNFNQYDKKGNIINSMDFESMGVENWKPIFKIISEQEVEYLYACKSMNLIK